MTQTKTAASWNRVSRNKVDPHLADVIDKAAAQFHTKDPKLGIIVTEGARTHKRQAELFRIGATRTLRSKHIAELQPEHRARAVDIAVTVGGKVRWDWPLYTAFAIVVKTQAAIAGVKLVWGGDWESFRDGPHFELA